MHTTHRLVSFACLLAAATAQNPCEGNGIGSAYITTTPAYIGVGLEVHIGSPAAANGLGLLVYGSGASSLLPECFDISGLFIGLVALFDANGDAEFNHPFGPGTYGLGPIYAKGIALEGGTVWSLSKSVRISVEHPNSSAPLPDMNGARSLHTCTALQANPADDRTGAFVAGGATGSMIVPVALASTQRFDTLSRTWSNGPNMALPRASHAAVRLLDGRILIAGGMTNAAAPATGGPAVAHCEIYNPATNTFSPTGAMLLARSGQAMTVLGDGRVFASGGFSDWTNAGPNFAARLSTAQTTTEIWSPVTGTWTVGPTMADNRAGHTQTLLANGKVLLASGIDAGTVHYIPNFGNIEIPTFTDSCEVFDPATNTLAATGTMVLARGFHGASRLPNGDVLVTGGAAAIGSYGEAAATNSCVRYNPTTGTWTTLTAALPTGVAFHSQVTNPINGAAWIAGGYVGNFASLVGSSTVVVHDGVSATTRNPLGNNPSLPANPFSTGGHAADLLHDGTMLVTGGYAGDSLTTWARSLLLIAY